MKLVLYVSLHLHESNVKLSRYLRILDYLYYKSSLNAQSVRFRQQSNAALSHHVGYHVVIQNGHCLGRLFVMRGFRRGIHVYPLKSVRLAPTKWRIKTKIIYVQFDDFNSKI